MTAAVHLADGAVGAVEVAFFPEGDHTLDVPEKLRVPGVDHELRAGLKRLRVAVPGLEDRDPADDCADDREAVLLRGPAVFGELPVQLPAFNPRGAELRRCFLVDDVERAGGVLAEHVEPAGEDEGVAGFGVLDREGDGEGELNALVLERPDEVGVERPDGEVVEKGRKHTFEGLDLPVLEKVVGPRVDDGEPAAFDCGFAFQAVGVESPPGGFETFRKRTTGVEVDRGPLRLPVVEFGQLELPGASEGRAHRV